MVLLMVKRKVAKQKLHNKNREELTFASCTSLDDVTPWCYTRIQVEKSSQFQKANLFWISGRPAGPRRLLGLLLPLLLRGAALPDQQVQHRTKPLAMLPTPAGTSNCPGTASQRAPTFGTWHSSTSPPGDPASVTPTIRLRRWLFTLSAPNH